MDLTIVRFLNGLGRGTLDPFTELLSSILFLALVWTGGAAAAVRFDKRDGRRAVATVLVALTLHFLISEAVLKHLLVAVAHMRVRPYLADPSSIVPVGTLFADSSFPSSHMASTAASVTAFSLFYPRARAFGVGFVLLMGFARMHNGMHYPTDVLAGTLLGIGYGLLARRLVMRWWPQPAAAVPVPAIADEAADETSDEGE